MRINGEWKWDENGVMTPVLICELLSGDGEWMKSQFLIDSGAERTVISPDILRTLDAPVQMALDSLVGVGAAVQVLTVSTYLRLKLDDGATITVNGPFFGLPQEREGELSILGRDVLGNFAVILDCPGDAIALLHGRHRYTIHEVA
ncbi:MAG: hypothetical protein U0791_21835 [Gemmataceae bacterium]